ncbi:MAG TPA: cell envelope integrity protein TolA [Xanthobacteraceae bacterium]|nr:cell envelope integrity protein TolA [Xanthobacteraceae bacterium]
MVAPKLLARSGFAISFLGHVAALTVGLFFAGAHPFDSAPAEAIMVDIISPYEIGQAAGAPETTSAFYTPTPAAAAELPPTPPPTLRPNPEDGTPQTPPPLQPMETGHLVQSLPPDPATQEPNIADMFGLPLALPDGRLGGGFDAPAIDRAKISVEKIATFREHLRTCLSRPGSIAPTDKVRVVLRVLLKPDGMLAATPTLIEASASAKGPVLMESAIRALRACQPYAMLPANKYEEWKVLDLNFTPQDFTGG